MNGTWQLLRRWWALVFTSVMLAFVPGCGGSGGGGGDLSVGDSTDLKKVLAAVPAETGGEPVTVRLHYSRPDANYAGWTLYVYNAPGEALGGWPGRAPDGVDAAGSYWDVPVASSAFNFIIVKGGGSEREPSGWSGANGDQQQYWALAEGTAIYKLAGDPTNYARNPVGASAPDLGTVRVHYRRYDGGYTNWGLHLWSGSGLDASRLPGVTIGDWQAAVAFDAMPGYAAGDGEIIFDIPVHNPKDDASRTGLEFIIHGRPPGGSPDDKDGRDANIAVNYATLAASGGVGEIWLVEGDATVYTAPPDLRQVSTRDARAYWLTRALIQAPRWDSTGVFKLYYASRGQIQAPRGAKASGADGALTLDVSTAELDAAVAERFKFVAPGVRLAVRSADQARLGDLLKRQLVLVQETADGLVRNATTAQLPGALDDLYAAAATVGDLGVTPGAERTVFKLWAPTAQKVSVAIYDSATGPTVALEDASFDAATGVWRAERSGDLSGRYYRWVVEVFVRGVGLVRQLVTDPYSVSLSADSKRSYVGSLSAAALKPAGWDGHTRPAALAAAPDMSIYELHVRDFSANDATVPAAHRGKYLAFTDTASNGMRHLAALAGAGLTDVHLLPVFDIATVPETGCVTPTISGAPDGSTQQAAVGAVKSEDCFNWGYDPFHFNAPEGSYATGAQDGAVRVREFRSMVMALHASGLRVGMDVVYNHTTAAGQNDKAVLDRVVPGYYQRLNAVGELETSTCCANTATENLMMGKLMVDSVVLWATQYGIDSFRFDLMGHQPRAVMQQLQAAVDAATGRHVDLIGEGWNFGEVADGARFVQASQLSLNGSGIATFSDRARDAVRGGSPFDGGDALIANQGYVNGLYYDPNALGGGKTATDLLRAADLVRVGLAGSIRDYTLRTYTGDQRQLQAIDYNGQPAGYVSQPGEVVNYVENHDNQTLFDIDVYKLPRATSAEDRARVQMLAAAVNVFSQGVAYFHAGIDTLRSKSLDRNSYDSGDWFNKLDWTYTSNNFGVGLPPEGDNGSNWDLMRPLLADSELLPPPAQIAWTRDAFRDLLRIRASSTLFRLRSADDVKARLAFRNTGASQVPTVLVGHLDGSGYAGAGFGEILYFVNVDDEARTLTIPEDAGKAWVLHPVHRAAGAADTRAATATVDSAAGRFTLPARTAVVFVLQ
ncbi:alpha-1,6-glucosidase domain-containing protein [Rubrivivax gelatinosus]|uniref:alpha-1,6-glucosidase domain-containing protein n=1 Tax=Rubrivivax gelatinosus TaxID=28068 RepID=UPI0002E4F8E5|nr:alpha-1,6-glucosidase domain-containing protein [Rubrivivax gelatinosus]MBG6080235.1 pullulanase/glycogen debranching enzyme [Rubrivivax gelatinosus]